jgi:hypothetical protein
VKKGQLFEKHGPQKEFQGWWKSFYGYTGRWEIESTYGMEEVIIAPGETVGFLHFNALVWDKEGEQPTVDRLKGLPPDLLEGLSDSEKGSIINFDLQKDQDPTLIAPKMLSKLSVRAFQKAGDQLIPIPNVVRIDFKATDPIFPIRHTGRTNGEGLLTVDYEQGGWWMENILRVPRGPVTVQAFTHVGWFDPITDAMATLSPKMTVVDSAGELSVDFVFTETGAASISFERPNGIEGTAHLTLTHKASNKNYTVDNIYSPASSATVLGLPPGEYHAVLTIDHPQGTALLGSTDFSVVASQKVDLAIPIEPTGHLEGEVKTLSGQQVSGLSVRIASAGRTYSAYTDQFGRYQFIHLPVEQAWLIAMAFDTRIESAIALNITAGTTVHQDIVLVPPSVKLNVRVLLPNGSPAVNAVVELHSASRDSWWWNTIIVEDIEKKGVTDQEGIISFDVLTTKLYVLRAFRPEVGFETFLTDQPFAFKVEGEITGTVTEVVTLSPVKTVKVVFPDGRPAVNAVVEQDLSIKYWSGVVTNKNKIGVTDQDGIIIFDVSKAKSNMLRAYRPESGFSLFFTEQMFDLKTDGEVVVRLPVVGTVKVIFPDGRPAVKAVVELNSGLKDGHGEVVMDRIGVTDKDGIISFNVSKAKSNMLRAYRPESEYYHFFTDQRFELETDGEIVVRLPSVGTVSVRVESASGQPIEYANIVMVRSPQYSRYDNNVIVRTQEGGLTKPIDWAGPITATLTMNGAMNLEVISITKEDVAPEEGEARMLVITLPARADLEVMVTHCGNPVPGYYIVIEKVDLPSGVPVGRTTNEKGLVVINTMLEGEYIVNVYKRVWKSNYYWGRYLGQSWEDFFIASVPVTIIPSDYGNLKSVPIPLCEVSISGQVVAGDGKTEVPNVYISFKHFNGTSLGPSLLTDDGGYFNTKLDLLNSIDLRMEAMSFAHTVIIDREKGDKITVPPFVLPLSVVEGDIHRIYRGISEPITDATLFTISPDALSWSGGVRHDSPHVYKNGKYLFLGLPIGDFEITAHTSNNGQTETRKGRIEAIEQAVKIDIVFPPINDLRVLPKDADGNPLKKGSIAIDQIGAPFTIYRDFDLGEEEEFILERLPAGVGLAVSIKAYDVISIPQFIVLPETDALMTATLSLPQTGFVSGMVPSPFGLLGEEDLTGKEIEDNPLYYSFMADLLPSSRLTIGRRPVGAFPIYWMEGDTMFVPSESIGSLLVSRRFISMSEIETGELSIDQITNPYPAPVEVEIGIDMNGVGLIKYRQPGAVILLDSGQSDRIGGGHELEYILFGSSAGKTNPRVVVPAFSCRSVVHLWDMFFSDRKANDLSKGIDLLNRFAKLNFKSIITEEKACPLAE